MSIYVPNRYVLYPSGGTPVDVQFQISVNTDDGGGWEPSTWFPALAHSNIGEVSGTRVDVGKRFQNVTIPQGATINSADLTFKTGNMTGSWASFNTIRVHADDVDDAPAWSSSSRPGNMTNTTAFTDWTPSSGDDNATIVLDVTSVIQEIIDRGGWSSGNDLRLGMIPQGTISGSNYLEINHIEHGAGNEALLDVNYTA